MNSPLGGAMDSLSLLIFPTPPSDISIETFRVAYAPPLSYVLNKIISGRSTASKAILDIAVACFEERLIEDNPRSTIYPFAQHVLGTLYELVCLVSTGQSIDDSKIDIRIILTSKKYFGNHSLTAEQALLKQGPLIPLSTLANSQRPWNHVYAVESEEGEDLLQEFICLRKSTTALSDPRRFDIDRVAGGIIVKGSKPQTPIARPTALSGSRHYSVAVGGTFDHLHTGHKLLLTATALALDPASVSDPHRQRSLTIGITGDELLKNKKFAEVLETWEAREQAVCQYLCAIIGFMNQEQMIISSERLSIDGSNGRAIHHRLQSGLIIKCVEISDAFGPTITDESITALVVSGETRSGGKAVNDKRAAKKWPLLEVFEVDVLNAGESKEGVRPEQVGDFQGKISSTEIRRKLVQRL